MRYYLDTNILYFLLLKQPDDICRDVQSVMNDYSNIFLTSSVCVHELIHIAQIGKAHQLKPEDIVGTLNDYGIQIVPVSEKHLQEYSRLPMRGDHRDPFDRLIIAQAIADKIEIISSDGKFRLYRKDGLAFMYNQR